MSNSNNHAPGSPEEMLGQEFEDGKSIAYDYGCALLERKTKKGYDYTGINLSSGRKLKICSRKDLPLDTDVYDMLKLIRISDIAGASRLQADRPVGEVVSTEKANEILRVALSTILPECSNSIDAGQRELAEHALNAIIRHDILPVEAELSEANIFSCLIAAIIVKRGRINDLYTRSLYPYMQYADMPKTPIVISVPNILMQREIIKEQLPILSDKLLDKEIIRETLNFVDRKGRENYVCTRKATNYLPVIRHRNRRTRLDKALKSDAVIDIADVMGLSGKDKNAISVDGSCSDTCPNHVECKYIEYLERAKSYDFDIQVCTHRYFIGDALFRAKGYQPLIPNYQSLIICDAYKYLQIAEDMYSVELSSTAVPDALCSVNSMSFHRQGLQNYARKAAKKLSDENARLFKQLTEKSEQARAKTCSTITITNADTARHLRNICDISDRLIHILQGEVFYAKGEELLVWIRKRYGADVSIINLNKLLSKRIYGEDPLNVQATAIYRAICSLEEIKRRISTEKAKKRKKQTDNSTARRSYARYIKNTENEAIGNVDSKIQDLIYNQSQRLLQLDTSTGKRSGQIIRLIRKIKHLQAQVEAIAAQNINTYRLETSNNKSRLIAAPKNLGKMLFSYQRELGIPTILISGTLPEGNNTESFKETFGLDNQCNI